MKSSIFLLLASSFVWGQTPAAPTQSAVRGPEAVAKQDPNRVVATINGQKVTAAEAQKVLATLPPQDLQRFKQQGMGLSGALQQLFMMRHFSELATQNHLDQQEPWKTQLQMTRDNLLAEAYITYLGNSSGIKTADIQSYYDSHQSEFEEARLSAILVSFSPAGAPVKEGTQTRTEQQAQEKAADLVKKLRAGADFATLARTESDNKPSAEKGGQLGSFTADKLPKNISEKVFVLKQGDITDPIREQNGFYILKIDSLTKKTFAEAQADIITRLKNENTRKIVGATFDQYKIQVQDHDFFDDAPATPSLQQPGQLAPKPQH